MALGYDPPGTSCSGGPTTGILALRATAMARWPALTDMGTYVCRKVVGGTGLSLHAEGRAWDAGTPGAEGVEAGHALAAWAVANADQLGVQEVIWQRRSWSSRAPFWKPYGGDGRDPHTGHVHIGLTRAAAAGLTADAAGVADAGLYGPGDDGGASKLTDPGTWLRVAGVVVGLVLVVVALVLIGRDLVGRGRRG